MSLDFRVALLPYKSSSFATPQAVAEQSSVKHFLRSYSILSTGCCAPAQRGKGGAVGTKGGKAAAKTLHRVFESAKVGP